jgi:hypothetical protein
MSTNSDPFGCESRPLSELLSSYRFTIHYYQREYRWGNRQIEELLTDLLDSFNSDYKSGDILRDVINYHYYFMGSIILINDHDKFAIIDGQQRLTSFTLLLIYFSNRQKEMGKDAIDVKNYIVSKHYGTLSYNIDYQDEERQKVIVSLFEGYTISSDLNGESAKTVLKRYKDIKEKLDVELDGDKLECFFQWCIDKIVFITITAGTEQDAYKMFVTMNDRGLNLNSAGMLKGFILSKIADNGERNRADEAWKQSISKIKSLTDINSDDSQNKGDLDFFACFLRAKYAKTLREGNDGDQDFELLGSSFHSWMFNRAETLGINKSQCALSFAERSVPFFAKMYCKIFEYSKTKKHGFERVFYNDCQNLNYQIILMISCIQENDDETTIEEKIKAVAYFVDSFSSVREMCFKKASWNSNKTILFKLLQEIRNSNLLNLCHSLYRALKRISSEQRVSIDSLHDFELNGTNSRFVQFLLARLTSHLEDITNPSLDNFIGYINTDIYQKEHIIADHFEKHTDEFSDQASFELCRNNIGDMVLLKNHRNESSNDDDPLKKIESYSKDNILAFSLNKDLYCRNPDFTRVVPRFGFKPYSTGFGKNEVAERAVVYQNMAKEIWNDEYLRTLSGGWDVNLDSIPSEETQSQKSAK